MIKKYPLTIISPPVPVRGPCLDRCVNRSISDHFYSPHSHTVEPGLSSSCIVIKLISVE